MLVSYPTILQMKDKPKQQRFFNSRQRAALFLRAGGKCTDCGIRLSKGFHADHRKAWSRGGATDVVNGAAVCPRCDLKKGSKIMDSLEEKTKKVEFDLPSGVNLREWQERALRSIATFLGLNFLLVAVPAAGKTLFALLVAWQFLREGRIKRVVIVCPSTSLRYHWAESAHKIGLNLDPNFRNSDGRESSDYVGSVVTYQQVFSNPDLFRANCAEDTLSIFDESHHIADELPWGKATIEAFEPAVFRLSLSGTPFRLDGNPIPFVNYVDNQCQANFEYGYGDALADKVVRSIYFPTIEGTATWLSSDGKFKKHSLLDAVSGTEAGERWRTILDPDGDWMRDVIRQANENLMEMRRNGHADAGGLIVALDQSHAERLVKTVEAVTGTRPVLAISDKPDAQETISRFRSSTEDWIIAVKLISEGVDMPRLRIGIYATNVSSELFLIQVIGRLLRKQGGEDDQDAALYIPYIPELIMYAERIKKIREHVLKERSDAVALAQNQNSTGQNAVLHDGNLEASESVTANTSVASGIRVGNGFLPISSESKLHHTIFDGEQYSREEIRQAEQINQQFGAPLAPVMVAAFLRIGMAMGAGEVVHSGTTVQNNLPTSSTPVNTPPKPHYRSNTNSTQESFDENNRESSNRSDSIPVFVQKKSLRQKSLRLAVQLAYARGTEIGNVHREWKNLSGVSQSEATLEQLHQKIAWLLNQINEVQKNGR